MEVIEEIADTSRPVLVITPLTQEALEIAQADPSLPTEQEAEMIQIAVKMSDSAAAILENPDATVEQKSAALIEIADLAKEAQIAPDEVIDAVTDDALTALVITAEREGQVIEYGIPEPVEKENGGSLLALFGGLLAAAKYIG
jgi:glycerol-3-phosphate dehydrogenase